jgi:hypothetical protein
MTRVDKRKHLTCGCGHSGIDVVPTHGHDAACAVCLATAVNAACAGPISRGRLPRLTPGNVSRQDLIDWLSMNDHHGCYTDAESIAHGWAPMTLDEAWATVAEAIADYWTEGE